MQSIALVVVDTMTFTYLQGLKTLDLLGQISVATGGVAVTKAVLMQLHRSGSLGPLAQSYCDREEMQSRSPKQGDPVTREVAKTLKKKEGMLVRRNRVDVELVEVARDEGGGVLTSERGIHRLCESRNVPALDLVVLFAWGARLGLVDEAGCDSVTAPWSTKSAAGTGCPPDFSESFSATAAKRQGLGELVDLLPALRRW